MTLSQAIDVLHRELRNTDAEIIWQFKEDLIDLCQFVEVLLESEERW